MTDLIQTIARAVRALADDEGSPNAIVVLHNRDDLIAQAALTVINEAGLVIVPRKDLNLGNTTLAVHGYIPIAAITTGETDNG